MKKILLFLTAVCFSVVSCTKDKTDYQSEIDTIIPEYEEFKEVAAIPSDGYMIHIETLNGTCYKGYNEVRLKVSDTRTHEKVHVSAATFLPIMTDRDGNNFSCPHRYDLVYKAEDEYFSGYAVFTTESKSGDNWKLYVSFAIDGKRHTVKKDILVREQVNKNLNMTAFTGKDNEQYVIALVSPQRPKVAENKLVAGIFKFNTPTAPPSGDFPDPSQFSYREAEGYTLALDPRMPEPSMGNHSSPNNKNLTQQSDGFYHGSVNYTMTGNWTLNFIMLNQAGRILKGTEVSKDFTPGVEGAKSELHLNILF